MKKVLDTLKQDNITVGYLYFYIHFITEIICFFYLTRITNGSNIVWIIPIIYDGLAFVPQSFIGYFYDKNKKLSAPYIGILLLILSLCIYYFTNVSIFISLILLCIGNCFIHIAGAETTIKKSGGKLSHSAIFVAGGSFGVVTGKLLATTNIPVWILISLILTIIPFAKIAETYEERDIKKYNYCNKSIKLSTIIILTIFIVIVRSYMGYGIPTAWNKTVIQTILLYGFMGIGKALGGILVDSYGIKKVSTISTLLAIPFLSFGDNIMIISLIGVMLFSMTMSITLGILVSCLKNAPGLAFGLTTLGLFLGTFPIFFFKIINTYLNIGIIAILSIICFVILQKVIRSENE